MLFTSRLGFPPFSALMNVVFTLSLLLSGRRATPYLACLPCEVAVLLNLQLSFSPIRLFR